MSRAKFQEVDYDYAPGSYGLVLLGYSLKPFGSREPLGELLFGLIDNARSWCSNIRRRWSAPPRRCRDPRAARRSRMLCSFDIALNDAEIAGSPYARRRFIVFEARQRSES